MIKRLVVILFLGLILPVLSYADEWRTLTDKRNVRDLLFLDGYLWLATSGGLAGFDVERKEFTSYSLLDGLAGIGISQLVADNDNGIWLLFDNRVVQRFEPENGITHTITQLSQETDISSLNDIAISEFGIHIATNRGVVLLSYEQHIDRWVVKTGYTKLGSFPVMTFANCVQIKGDKLWVGTDIGLACGDLTSAAPLTWQNYDVQSGLPGNSMIDLIELDDRILAATNGGISSWDGSSWTLFSSRADIKQFSPGNDSLRAVIRNGVITWNENDWDVNTRISTTDAAFDAFGNLWAGISNDGRSESGISLYSDSVWVNFQPEGPNTNSVDAIAFTGNGDMIFGGGRGEGEFGISRFDGTNWRRWTRPTDTEAIFSRQIQSIAIDHQGGIWAGSFGGGIARFNPDSTITFYDHSDETGARLANSEDVPSWTITPAVATDPFGNVWVVNHSASDGNTLVCIPRDYIESPSEDKEWYYFHRSLFNNFPYFERIAIDGRGRVWLASNATSTAIQSILGVYVLDPNGTPEDPSDDKSWRKLPGLNSGQVNSLAWDPAGYIWAGSVDGAYYIEADQANLADLSFSRIYSLRDVQINCVAIDPRGNRWFGTNFGVTVLDVDMFTISRTITSTFPDYLPSDNVRQIAIDPGSGWAYIATDEGTAALFTPYRDYGDKMSSLTIEPNPFNPNRGKLYFTGNSLAGSGSVKIFTPDGRLVRSLDNSQAALGWDGRDIRSNKIADGVYLLLAYNDSGNALQGKVAVIWK